MPKRIPEILIINQYYPPDTSATASIAQKVAGVLAKNFNVRIIAGRPSYNPDTYHPWYLFKTTFKEAVTVTRVGSSAMSRHNMIKRLINYFSYLILLIPQVIISNPSAILCMTDPPIAGLIGAFFTKRKKCPFIYYMQDLHPDMAISSGMIKSGFLLFIWKLIHHWILKKADLIIVLDEDMRRRIISKGFKTQKIVVIRHGALLNFHGDLPGLGLVEQISKNFDFTVVYAGNLGFYGAWTTLIKAAKILEPDNIGFVFIGEGAYKKDIQKLASNCSNVRFLPFQPEENVPNVLASGDIHLITIQSGIEGMVSPSKFYPILAAGRPVIGVVHRKSDLAAIITRSKCGVVSDPDDPDAVAETIRILSQNPEKLAEMSRQASRLSIEYDSVKQFNKFLQVVEKTINTYPDRIQRKIKVLIIISRMNIGGASVHVKLLQEGLNTQYFESRLVTGKISSKEGDMSYILNASPDNILYVPELQRELQLASDFKSFLKIFMIINREKPQIVHSHTAKAGTLARISTLLYNTIFQKNIKMLHTFHGHVFEGYFDIMQSRLVTYAERTLARFTDVIIALSQTQREDLVNKYKIAKDEKMETIKLGFNLDYFLNSFQLQGQFKKELGLSKDYILIGIIGRLVPIKNHIMFFEAARLLKIQYPELKIKFVIIGDGELKPELEQFCFENNLSDHVRFCGWIKNIPYVYADLDIVALTSINEGTPVSIIEAMTSSVPTISTDAGGIKDLLGKIDIMPSSDSFQVCERGILLPTKSARSLSNGIKYILDNQKAIHDSIVSEARAFVIENYNKKRMNDDIEALYFKVLGREGLKGR